MKELREAELIEIGFITLRSSLNAVLIGIL